MDLKFFKFFKNKKNIKKNDFVINTNIYWYSLLILFFLIVFTGFAFVYFNFKKLNKDFFYENTITNKENLNKKNEINEILNYFEDKKVKLNSINEINIIDPAL